MSTTEAKLVVLRPALEMAVAVARAGEKARPRQEAPPGLRALLHFTRLPERALVVTLQVVDDDDAFRSRVAEEVDEEAVGHAGFLWLSRPRGWEEEFETLVGVRERAAIDAEDTREQRRLERRLSGAQAALDRAEARIRELETRAAEAGLEVADERERRLGLEREVARLGEAVEELDRDKAEAVRQLKETEKRLDDRVSEVQEIRRELDEASMVSVPPELAEGLGEAEALVGALADLLGGLSSAIEAPAQRPEPAATASAGRARRRPVRMKQGITADSPAAAAQLFAVPDIVVLVDGYNVTMEAWPQLGKAEQRSALVAGVAQLHARWGSDIRVIFDSDTEEVARSFAVRDVAVSYAPPDREADDVIIDELDALPVSRNVVVVSSDRRVRDGARAAGANLLHARQLVDVLK